MRDLVRAMGWLMGWIQGWLSPPAKPEDGFARLWASLRDLEGRRIAVKDKVRELRVSAVTETHVRYSVRRLNMRNSVTRAEVYALWQALLKEGSLSSEQILATIPTRHASYVLAMLGEAGAVSYETSSLGVALRQDWLNEGER